MTDSLRQAVDHIIDHWEQWDAEASQLAQVEQEPEAWLEYMRGQLVKVLASHPTDDSEPLTEAWLKSVGPPKDSINIAEFRIPTMGMYGGLLEFRRSGEVHLFGIVLAKPPKTRGDVRRLAAALGIPLQENQQ